MDATDANAAVVRSYLGAVERFDREAVERLVHPEIVQTEFPNRLKPAGATRGFAELVTDLERGAALLASQRYEVLSLTAATPGWSWKRAGKASSRSPSDRSGLVTT